MKTKTYIKRLEKTYKCELKDSHSEKGNAPAALQTQRLVFLVWRIRDEGRN